jgi:hypothetical protein
MLKKNNCIGLKPNAIEIGRGDATRIQLHSDERFDGACEFIAMLKKKCIFANQTIKSNHL